VAFVVFLLAAAAATAIIRHSELHNQQEERTRVSDFAGDHADALERNIEQALAATYTLATLVRQGKGSVPGFEEVAGEMLRLYPSVSELALAPGGSSEASGLWPGTKKPLGSTCCRTRHKERKPFSPRIAES